MQKYQELKVLSYVKKDVQSVFQGENTPKLLYVGKTRPAASAHPRIMHSHQDFLEMVLIVSGSGEYFIHDKVCHVEAGDLLIYNSGVVHDEFAGNKIEIGSYCIAFECGSSLLTEIHYAFGCVAIGEEVVDKENMVVFGKIVA